MDFGIISGMGLIFLFFICFLIILGIFLIVVPSLIFNFLWVLSFSFDIISHDTAVSIFIGLMIGLLGIYFTVLAITIGLSKEVNIGNSIKYVLKNEISVSILSSWTLTFVSVLILNYWNISIGILILYLSIILMPLLVIDRLKKLIGSVSFEKIVKKIFEDVDVNSENELSDLINENLKLKISVNELEEEYLKELAKMNELVDESSEQEKKVNVMRRKLQEKRFELSDKNYKVLERSKVIFKDFVDLFAYSEKTYKYKIVFKEYTKFFKKYLEDPVKLNLILLNMHIALNLVEKNNWFSFSGCFDEFLRSLSKYSKFYSEENIDNILHLQNIHAEKIKKDFMYLKEFSPELNSQGYFLKNYFLSCEHSKLGGDNEVFVKKVMENTTNIHKDILNYILKYPNIPNRKIYLRSYIQNMLLTFVRLCSSNEADRTKIHKAKIKNIILKTMYDLMYYIEKEEFGKDYFNLVFEIFSYEKYDTIHDVNVWTHVYEPPEWPLNEGYWSSDSEAPKYWLILMFRKYLENKNIFGRINHVPQYVNFDKRFNEIVDKLNSRDVKRFFDDFTDYELNSFKFLIKLRIEKLCNP